MRPRSPGLEALPSPEDRQSDTFPSPEGQPGDAVPLTRTPTHRGVPRRPQAEKKAGRGAPAVGRSPGDKPHVLGVGLARRAISRTRWDSLQTNVAAPAATFPGASRPPRPLTPRGDAYHPRRQPVRMPPSLPRRPAPPEATRTPRGNHHTPPTRPNAPETRSPTDRAHPLPSGEPRRYRPRKFGARFSRNARTPSAQSSVCRNRAFASCCITVNSSAVT